MSTSGKSAQEEAVRKPTGRRRRAGRVGRVHRAQGVNPQARRKVQAGQLYRQAKTAGSEREGREGENKKTPQEDGEEPGETEESTEPGEPPKPNPKPREKSAANTATR